MNKNFKTAETGSSERANQQPKETSKSAVRKLQQPVISTVMKENLKIEERNSQERLNQILTASTPETGRVYGGSEVGWSLALCSCLADERQGHQTNRGNKPQQTPNGRKDSDMKNEVAVNGNTRMGVKVQNIATLPNSSAQHVRAVGDLKVGRFVFKGVTFSREDGKEAVVKLPWETQMVSIPNEDDLAKVNREVAKQINQAADGLKQATVSTGLWN